MHKHCGILPSATDLRRVRNGRALTGQKNPCPARGAMVEREGVYTDGTGDQTLVLLFSESSPLCVPLEFFRLSENPQVTMVWS